MRWRRNPQWWDPRARPRLAGFALALGLLATLGAGALAAPSPSSLTPLDTDLPGAAWPPGAVPTASAASGTVVRAPVDSRLSAARAPTPIALAGAEPAVTLAAAPPTGAPRAAASSALETARPLRDWARRSLGEIAPDAVAAAAQAPGPIGVAVFDLTQARRYGLNADDAFRLASVGKVAMMLPALTAVGEVETADRIAAMIQRSDNAAATAIWRRWGAPEVRAALAAMGLDGVRVDPVFWGRAEGTADEVARLLAAFVAGDALPAETRALGQAFLDTVISEQSWGISAGLPAGWSVGLKNGWTVYEGAWLVHSAGYVRDPDGTPRYVVTILSAGHVNLERGVRAVEAVARQIYVALLAAD